MFFNTKDEYDKYINPDEFERRMRLIQQGAENAKRNAEKKKRYIEAKQRWRRRQEVSDRYDI